MNHATPRKSKAESTQSVMHFQRRRDDNKNKIFGFFGGGGLGGREENRPKRLYFRGKRHDNKILKVLILLSRNFVVIAQAPTLVDEI